MIYDKLSNIGLYKGCFRWLDTAIDFLLETDLNTLPLGRTEIHGKEVFANVMLANAGCESDVKFEIHKKYMDIQIDLEGVEEIQIGSDIIGEDQPFDAETDFGTVLCSRSVSCTMGPERFILCLASEPHKPGIACIGNRALKKCVIKVLADNETHV